MPEAEWWAVAPPGVSVHAARVTARAPWARWRDDRKGVEPEEDLLRGCRQFAAMRLQAVTVAHSSSSLLGGKGWDEATAVVVRHAGIREAFDDELLSILEVAAAKVNAQSDPLLCKLTIGPITKLTSSIQGLVGKAKTGRLNPTEVAGSSSLLDQFTSASSGAGAPVREQTPSVPGLG